ncbi:hypothetical protein T05_2252 [Trichinella murrelli]|uniref:Uncharacterized protein n=1 Tax=Trichinella murrelli TaxID=144512 RepID=A0A0V0U4U4_9BILA|nr:hypothetical protein T05_2252 [Trichinella murrelli]
MFSISACRPTRKRRKRRRALNRSIWIGVQPPAGCSMKSLRSALSRQTLRGISVLRLLPCRPHGVGGTMCALGGRTLLLVQPSCSPDTAAWLTSNHNCPCHFVLGVARPW